MCLHFRIKEINFESTYFLHDWMHWNSSDCYFFRFDPVVFKFYFQWLIFMHTEYTSAQCRMLSPDYLLMFSNEVCMWAWFQGNFHDAYVGTGNRRRNHKLSTDPLQDLWEAFQRGEQEYSGKKNQRCGSAMSSCSKTLEALTSLDQWWCFQGLWGSYVAMISDSPCGWVCISCMWAVSPLRVRICFSLWPLLDPVWCREKKRICKEFAFLHHISKIAKVYDRSFVLWLLGSNLRGIVTYKASKCRLQATLMMRCSILTHIA